MKYYSLLLLSLVVSPLSLASKPVQYHRPLDFIQEIKNDPDRGYKIYAKICATCHAENPLINAGAPKYRNTKDWEPRMKQGNKQMLQNIQDNKGIMPARGGCFECSDAELMAAIEFMLPQKNKN